MAIRSNSTTTESRSTQAAQTEPILSKLQGLFHDQAAWKLKLDKKLAHASLGLPMDDDVNVDNSQHGIGLKELLAIGLLGTGAIGLLQLPTIIDALRPQPTEPATSGSDSETISLGLGKLEDYAQ